MSDLDGIGGCIRQVLRTCQGVDASTLAVDVPGWDSFATVEIIFAVEERFGCRMSSEEMERIDGVQALLAIVARARMQKVA